MVEDEPTHYIDIAMTHNWLRWNYLLGHTQYAVFFLALGSFELRGVPVLKPLYRVPIFREQLSI